MVWLGATLVLCKAEGQGNLIHRVFSMLPIDRRRKK